MKKTFFLIALFLILSTSLVPNISSAKENKVCATYFTYVGCPNCAQTDPIVLDEWPQQYSDLVVIEYMWQANDFDDPNAKFFGNYAHQNGFQCAVPCLSLADNKVNIGRNNVPQAEGIVKNLDSSSCALSDKDVSFDKLNLSELKANPKIWANGRILIKKDSGWIFQWSGSKIKQKSGSEKADSESLKNLLFTDDISSSLQGIAFEEIESQRAKFSGSAFPESEIKKAVEFDNAVKIEFSDKSTDSAVGSPNKKTNSSKKEKSVKIPLLGKIETRNFSLPVLTFLLGLADGFNPCAFFIVTFLLAALVGLAGLRKKIILVGSIFIFFSGLMYFLFMALLLNVFQLGQGIGVLTIIAGLIAVIAGLLNIKDYFFFQEGVSLTLPKSSREKFVKRVKRLKTTDSMWALAIGTAIIAGAVNLYELLCTFGFPMIYTTVLSLRNLSSFSYYLYLVFYNLVYIVPIAIIVIIFAVTLGEKKFSEKWVRRLKLSSGFMILFLGIILMVKPKLLEHVSTAFGALVSGIVVATLVVIINRFLKKRRK